MSVIFTVELRVDCGDAKKYLLARKIINKWRSRPTEGWR